MIVTVAICTWNRARLLDRTLAEFGKLAIPPGIGWELLVVNNNCTDDTDAVIARHGDALPIRRVFEPKPGHSRARNRAVAEAAGELILWTDDDVLVAEGWLAAYVRAATDWPSASFFGGPIEPEFEVEPPAWIADNLARLADPYAIRRLGPETRALAAGEVVLGANMAARASALRDFAFDVRFGVLEAEKISGDDVDFQQRLVEAGRSGVWVGSASVRHIIPADRLTRRYLQHCFRGHGRMKARREGALPCPHLLGYPRFAIRKYLTARLAMARSRAGDRPWVDAMATSAFLEGYLAEVRQSRRSAPVASGSPPPPPGSEAGHPVRKSGTRAVAGRSN